MAGGVSRKIKVFTSGDPRGSQSGSLRLRTLQRGDYGFKKRAEESKRAQKDYEHLLKGRPAKRSRAHVQCSESLLQVLVRGADVS